MMDYKKTFVYFVLLVLVVLGYQNCAIYESGGKAALESMIQKNSGNSCSPYLSNNAAAQIMMNNVTVRFNVNPPIGSVAQCDIAMVNPVNSIDSITCGLSNSYSSTAALQNPGGILSASQATQISMLNQDPSNFIEVNADPLPALSGGSFAYSYKVENKVVLRFLGANNSSSVGVACYVVFSSLDEFQDPVVGKTPGLARLAEFVHAIVGNL